MEGEASTFCLYYFTEKQRYSKCVHVFYLKQKVSDGE